MIKGILVCILLLQLATAMTQVHNKPTRRFLFKNNCGFKVWVGGYGIPQLSRTGWQMGARSQTSLNVNSQTKAIRFWPRTGCSQQGNQFRCESGDCGGRLQCNGATGKSPATLAQFTLSGAGGADFYDISNVDGNNINLAIDPIPGSFRRVNNNGLGKFNCGAPVCRFNQRRCPPELSLNGKYCYNLCAAVYDPNQVNKNRNILGQIANNQDKKDLVCCACGAGTNGCTDRRSKYCCSPLQRRSNIGGKCFIERWPKPSRNFNRYDKVFKDQCPDAYSWQFDDNSSTYQCLDADYKITFCP